MLECRACVVRCIRAVAGASAPSLNCALLLTPRITAIPARRKYTTVSTTASPDPFATSYLPSGRTSPKQETARLTSTSTQRALQAELKFLTDPLKLASHIHYVLRQNDPAKALDLVRLASKATKSASDVVVAWNHCVDWHMRSGRVSEGVKIYNEMKKRGVFPDAHTYTLLFRSFIPKPGDKVSEGTVVKATSIYYSMLTPTSRIKPGIIHTNAILRVCALAGDMDALWGVAARIPQDGPGSADTITYTILLSAIRFGAMGSPDEGGVYLEQVGGRRQSAVNEGRRIWMECIAKWRSGDLVIDSELVCQMGNLLLISNRMEDWDDVLSLVEQTTRIPRRIVPLSHPGRRIGHVPQETSIGDDVVQSSATEAEDQDGFVPTPASKAFDALPATKTTSSPIWVRPGNPILSILIQACLTMRIPKVANEYWEIITSPPHSLVPDVANHQAMLRLFKINRSSAKAAALVEKMHSAEGGSIPPRGITYRDAMAVCARDHKNPSIMKIATRIVEDMRERLQYPDVKTLQSYLSLAETTDPTFETLAALDRLEIFRPMITARIFSGKDEEEDAKNDKGRGGVKAGRKSNAGQGRHNERSDRDKDDAIAFVKQMASSIQKLIETNSLTKGNLSGYTTRRNQLNRTISKVENRNVRNWHHESGGEGIVAFRTKREKDQQREWSGGATGGRERAQYEKAVVRSGQDEGEGVVRGRMKRERYQQVGKMGEVQGPQAREKFEEAFRPKAGDPGKTSVVRYGAHAIRTWDRQFEHGYAGRKKRQSRNADQKRRQENTDGGKEQVGVAESAGEMAER